MHELVFEIFPIRIPLGKTSEVTLAISHTGWQDLENVRGRLRHSPAISLLGLHEINISKIPVGEKILILLRIVGIEPGKLQINLTSLNARTAGGATLDFVDRHLEIEISDVPEVNVNDVVITLEPDSLIRQHMIGNVKYRFHNNSRFSISLPELNVSADRCDVYMSKGQGSGSIILPGTSFEFESEVLPRLAGDVSVFVELSFHIQQWAFSQSVRRILTIVPSNQPYADESPGEVRTILLISSAPRSEEVIRTDKEIKNILFEMKKSAPWREHFQVEVLPAATTEDLMREVVIQHPYLLHFAGHGTDDGIILEDEKENGQELSARNLLALLQPLSDRIECVVLNSCSSFGTARILAQCIRYVVGMRDSILDDAALTFSKGFYEAIGAGHSIEKACELGKKGLAKDHFGDRHIPVFFKEGKIA